MKRVIVFLDRFFSMLAWLRLQLFPLELHLPCIQLDPHHVPDTGL